MLSTQKINFVVPAAPGYFVLSPCLEEAGPICEASRDSIVAWAIDELGTTIPVTPHEVLNGDDDHAILCLDGQVMAFDTSWEDVADWLAWLNEQNATAAKQSQG